MTATLAAREPARQDPRRLSPTQLAQLGVKRLNRFGSVLQCSHCGATWSPLLRKDQTLPHGYTQCPNRCNW